MLKELQRIIKSFGFMALLFLGLVIITLVIIRVYTGHDKPNVKVPQIEGLRVDEAVKLLEKEGFAYEITDTVYRDGVELQTIIDQNPEADFEVKKGRKIYLVLNTDEIPKVPMPDLAGRTSLKEAIQMLKIKGLELGKTIEKPDASVMDPNSKPVLDQYLAGDTVRIQPGTQIERHSKIDLVIGVMIENLEGDPEDGTEFPDKGEEAG